MTLSQEFWPMGAQFSLKAALPLSENIATATDRYNNTGPRCLLRGIHGFTDRLSLQRDSNMGFEVFFHVSLNKMSTNRRLVSDLRHHDAEGTSMLSVRINCLYSETRTKWRILSRRHFQIRFPESKFLSYLLIIPKIIWNKYLWRLSLYVYFIIAIIDPGNDLLPLEQATHRYLNQC